MRLLLAEGDESLRTTLRRDLARAGMDADHDSNVIEVYINRLRQKVGRVQPGPCALPDTSGVDDCVRDGGDGMCTLP